MMETPSYHDLYITTDETPRISIFNLPFGVRVTCTRTGGWEIWDHSTKPERLLAGEYDDKGLRLDVNGVVIVDSLTEKP